MKKEHKEFSCSFFAELIKKNSAGDKLNEDELKKEYSMIKENILKKVSAGKNDFKVEQLVNGKLLRVYCLCTIKGVEAHSIHVFVTAMYYNSNRIDEGYRISSNW